MKQLIILVILLTGLSSQVIAQSSDRIRIEDQENVDQAIGSNDQFRFKEFKKGKVYFKNGRSSTALLNYNLLYDAIMFIDKKADTLSLADPVQLKYVVIEDSYFYYDNNGYLEIIADFPSVKLAYKQVLKVSNREKVGGYGQNTNTSAIDNYSSVYNNNESFSLNTNENVIFSKKSSFYLLDQNNKFSPASKRSVIKIFPKKHKKSIVKFIDDNKTDFKKESKIKELLQFCSDLI